MPEPIHIGITGTRYGGTEYQLLKCAKILSEKFIPGSEFHHGDCVELGRTETQRSSAFIESLDDFSKRNEFYKKERELAQTWKSVEDAARAKDLTALKELVAKLENM